MFIHETKKVTKNQTRKIKLDRNVVLCRIRIARASSTCKLTNKV